MNVLKTSWASLRIIVIAASIFSLCRDIRQSSKEAANDDMAGYIDTNSDFYGILEIKGLLREPVVQGADNSFYLSHGFDRSDDRNGCLFIDEEYREGCMNLIIYGHNSFNGTGFSNLTRYKKPGYASDHREIMMTGKDGSCSVFRVAMVLNYSVGDLTICDPFRAQLPADCLSRYRNYARYYIDENMQINSSSRILTLSTCDETVYGADGRLIIIAIKED